MTVSSLGFTLLILTLNLCLYSIIGSLIGVRVSSNILLKSCKNASYCTLITLGLSVACLVYAFVTRDFSIKYVFNHSSLSMNPIYTWVAMYAGNEGSLLYIGFIISVASFFTLLFLPSELNDAEPYLVSILSGFLLFFVGVMVLLANPFETFEIID